MVHENTRNLGIAGYLMGRLAEIAKQRGVEAFWASVMPNNRPMAGLFLAVGGKESKASMDEERTFTIDLDGILNSREKFLQRKQIETIKR